MTIVADRGLFVRLLVQSGKFEHAQAEALVDTIDATTKEPATKADLDLLRLRVDESEKRMNLRFDAVDLRFDAMDKRFDAIVEKLFVRMIGVGLGVAGLIVAILRYL